MSSRSISLIGFMGRIKAPDKEQKGRCLGPRKTRREGRKQGNSGSGVKSRALLFIRQNYVVHLARVLSILWKIVHVKVSIGVAKFILQLRLFRHWEAVRVYLYQSRLEGRK